MLQVTVTAQRKNVAPATVLGPPRVEIVGAANGSNLKPPFRLQFHASGFNIAPAVAQLADTPYFRLVLSRPGAKPEVLAFKSGQTEALLNPPKGPYTAQLELVRNATRTDTIAARSPALAFVVGP